VLARKKPQEFVSQKLHHILESACLRGVLAKISCEDLKFNGAFLGCDDQGLVIDNRLLHLDDVRRLRNKTLHLYFPFRKTLLKCLVRFVGLTTFKGIRALRLTLPEVLVTDEKRGVKRVRNLPSGCDLTFHTPDLHIFHSRIIDASPSGFALYLPETTANDDLYLIKTHRFQADAILDQQLKLSFQIEIRHISSMPKIGTGPAAHRVGVKIVKLTPEAQTRLNNWLLQCNMREPESDAPTELNPQVAPARPPKRTGDVLVIGPDRTELDFWFQCLGRKYEVITSDDNIANIRDALNTNPTVLLVYLDAQNPEKASFTRKFCTTLNGRYPIIFFAREPDEKKQATLMGLVANQGFIDISERKIITWFRTVDEVISRMNG
jgi:PilZ domain